MCYVTYCVSCVTSFTTPLPWLHGIVKCPMDTHLRISPEIVSHPGIFAYIFINTMHSDILLILHLVICLLHSREISIFGFSHFVVYECQLALRCNTTTYYVGVPTSYCCWIIYGNIICVVLHYISISFLKYHS